MSENSHPSSRGLAPRMPWYLPRRVGEAFKSRLHVSHLWPRLMRGVLELRRSHRSRRNTSSRCPASSMQRFSTPCEVALAFLLLALTNSRCPPTGWIATGIPALQACQRFQQEPPVLRARSRSLNDGVSERFTGTRRHEQIAGSIYYSQIFCSEHALRGEVDSRISI